MRLPGIQLLRNYDRKWLRGDLVAGITLAAYVLPAAIGDATLAGLPPEAGLYACMASGLLFWLFCSSRLTAISVTSAISLVMGTSLAPMAKGDPARFAVLAAATALLVAVIAFAAWLAKAGGIVTFISESVMAGFKTGVALHLTSTQLPKLFGYSGSHGDFWERMHHFLTHLPETNPVALGVGLAALAALIAGKVFFKNRPVALFVVIAGILAGVFCGFEAHGVKVLGEVPRGLPTPGFPALGLTDLNNLLPLAFACFLLGAVETAAIGRMFAAKSGSRMDANQEFLALAAANLASGLWRGFPVSGGMSQSLVNESGGARTPVSGLVSAVCILLVTAFLSGMLRTLPQPVLAAVVLVAVAGLVKVSVLRRLWRIDRTEFVVAAAALIGVLGQGLLRGVLIGCAISLLMLLRRTSTPHVAFLGRIPGSRRFTDTARHPDNEPVPGMLLFRVEAAILYFNADHVCDTVLERVRACAPPPRMVVADLSSSPHVDLAGAEMLASLHGELARQGIGLHLVETRASVRDTLRMEGLEEKVGGINRFSSVADCVEQFHPATL